MLEPRTGVAMTAGWAEAYTSGPAPDAPAEGKGVVAEAA